MPEGDGAPLRERSDAGGREAAPQLSPVFAVLVVEGEAAPGAAGDGLQGAVTRLVRDLHGHLARLAQDAPAVYGPGAGSRTVLRVLATGAGGEPRLAARVAAALGFPLHRVSAGPAVPEVSAIDERRVIVGDDPATAGATSGVSLAQEAALAFSDLLLVTWDGRSAGPHRQVIREAAVCGKAIVWVHPDRDVRLLEGSRLTEVTRHLLRAGHPSAEMLAALFAPLTPAALGEALAQVANPRAGKGRDRFGTSLGRYFTQPPPHALASRLSGRLHTLVARVLTSSREGPPPHDPPPTPRDEADVLPASLQARKRWSSRQARHAAGAVRDAGWVLWLFSPVAVFAAAAGAIELWTDPGSQAWVVLELAALALIVLLVLFAKRRDWHGQWLQHRFVAEQLRYQQLAYPLLTFLPVFTRAIPVQPESWLLRRALVEAGLPGGARGDAFLADGRLRERREHVLAAIHGQIAYHAAKHHGLERMEKRLERFATGAFLLTALAASSHLLAHWHWIVLLTTTLPATAAAAHGLLSSLEVKRLAAQSRTAQARLSSLREALQGVPLEAPDAWPRVRYLVGQAVRTMSDDAEQWRELVDHHGVDLPA